MIRRLAWVTGLALGVGLGTGTIGIPMGLGLEAFSLPAIAAPARADLALNSQGSDVAELQAMLKLLGFYGGEVSGRFDETTRFAVLQFQQILGLPTTGKVDATLWNRLLPSTVTVSATPVVAKPSPSPNRPAAPVSAASFPQPSGTKPAAAPPTSPNTPAKPAAAKPAAAKPAAAKPAAAKPAAAKPASGPQYFASAAESLPVLQLGDEGDAVVHLQQRLKGLGFFQGAVDGAFGPQTEAAVIAAQTRWNLGADGIVGPATWRRLLR